METSGQEKKPIQSNKDTHINPRAKLNKNVQDLYDKNYKILLICIDDRINRGAH